MRIDQKRLAFAIKRAFIADLPMRRIHYAITTDRRELALLRTAGILERAILFALVADLHTLFHAIATARGKRAIRIALAILPCAAIGNPFLIHEYQPPILIIAAIVALLITSHNAIAAERRKLTAVTIRL